MEDQIDLSQDLIFLFAPRIQEQTMTRTLKKTQTVSEYVYRKPREAKLSKIQKYFYMNPYDYVYILDYCFDINPDTNKKYKAKEIAKIIQSMTNASFVSCANEVRRIRRAQE